MTNRNDSFDTMKMTEVQHKKYLVDENFMKYRLELLIYYLPYVQYCQYCPYHMDHIVNVVDSTKPLTIFSF